MPLDVLYFGSIILIASILDVGSKSKIEAIDVGSKSSLGVISNNSFPDLSKIVI